MLFPSYDSYNGLSVDNMQWIETQDPILSQHLVYLQRLPFHSIVAVLLPIVAGLNS